MRRSFADWLDQPLLAINKQMVRERHAANKERFGHPYADYGMRVLSGVVNHVAACYEDAEGRSCISSNPVQVLSRLRLWDKQRRRTNIVKNSDLPH